MGEAETGLVYHHEAQQASGIESRQRSQKRPRERKALGSDEEDLGRAVLATRRVFQGRVRLKKFNLKTTNAESFENKPRGGKAPSGRLRGDFGPDKPLSPG